jgi:hypothetical protein
MCKMVAWLPREKQPERAGRLFLTSAPETFLTAVDAKQDRLWVIHADQLRRWIAEHARQLQKWSDDSKMEARRGRRSFASRREAACKKYDRRMDTAVQQFAAQVVGYAARSRFAEIQWVEPAERHLPAFRWAALLDRMATKCAEIGINFLRETANERDAKKTG